MEPVNKHECPEDDEGKHDWSAVDEGRDGYRCNNCGLRIPAKLMVVKNDKGRPLRNPLTRATVMAPQPADEAFADYVMAMNGGW